MTAQRGDCLCGRDEAPQDGDQARIGDVISSGIEPGERYARIVGFRKNTDRFRVIIRVFQPGDGRFPTGHYRTTGLPSPWRHPHPTTEVPR